MSEKQVTALRFLLLFFNDGFYHFIIILFFSLLACYFFLANLKHFLGSGSHAKETLDTKGTHTRERKTHNDENLSCISPVKIVKWVDSHPAPRWLPILHKP